MTRQRLVSLLFSFLVCSPAAASDTRLVDCSRGDSVQDAVANGNRNQPLAVLIRGTCVGDIEISRDDVTLQGDGGMITGSVTVNGGQRAVIAGLTISNPAGDGVLVANGGSATLRKNDINDNAGYGVLVHSAAFAILEDNRMLRNGVVNPTTTDASGIGVQQGSIARGMRNEMGENANTGLQVGDGSFYRSERDTIAMRTAAPVGRSAVDIFRAGYADMYGVTVNGRVIVNQQSQLQMRNIPDQESSITGDISVSTLTFFRLRAGVERKASTLTCGGPFSVCACDGFPSCPVSVP